MGSSPYRTRLRSHTLAELRDVETGTAIQVCGWLRTVEAGGKAFELYDRFGSARVECGERPELRAVAAGLRPGAVVRVDGRRAAAASDEPLPRIEATRLEILSRAEQLPLDPTAEGEPPALPVRLRHRHLDLRRRAMQERLQRRQCLQLEIRHYLTERGFLEIDTPLLQPWSDEATSAFVVPAAPGRLFALAQSPQLYKQLLMVAGTDRYFQIARCFRRESELGPERQPEFTVLDFEMAMVEEGDIFELIDGLLAHVLREVWGVRIRTPLPRMSYAEAIERYGSDRPDPRLELEFVDAGEALRGARGPLLEPALNAPGGGTVRAARLRASQLGGPAEAVLEQVLAGLRTHGAEVRWLQVASGRQLQGSLARALDRPQMERLLALTQAEPPDVILLVIDPSRHRVGAAIGELRQKLARTLLARRRPQGGEGGPPPAPSLLWIHRYPYFGWSATAGGYLPCRHPFTRPLAEDLDRLRGAGLPASSPAEQDTAERAAPGQPLGASFIGEDAPPERRELLKVRSYAYELIMDGEELLTGSIRNHDLRVQQRVFAMFGYDRTTIERRFGPLLAAFQHGVPPHGGGSLGLDRLLMRMEGVDDLCEVIPFPKDHQGSEPLTGAPSAADPELVRTLLGL
ncbi:MAG: aspartate--tRNA(Asp/Asn) ligase [Planctomycetota bacterium]|nr:MAG: aspartate--tRNA(Asp/Asn) ligase [Planctomycetota bacterium]